MYFPNRVLVWVGTFLFCTLHTNAQSPPQIIGVTPTPQEISAPPNTMLTILFDRVMDSLSVNDSTFQVFGRWSGVMTGSFSWEDGYSRLIFTPDADFFSGEWVTVSLSREIRDSDQHTLSHGFTFNFWIATHSSSLELNQVDVISVRQPGEGHIQTYGAYAGDLNRDGYTDYTVPNEISNDVRVFLNDQQGGYQNFEIFPLPSANRPSTNEGADFNGDGFIDIAVGNTQNNQVQVLLGDGNGQFLSINSFPAGNGVRGLSVADFDDDGDMDIITANRVSSNLSILLNDGNGLFSAPIYVEGGGDGETACAVADADGDGILDVFVGSYQSDDIQLLIGDGNGGLVLSSSVNLPAGSRPWMITVGDVNHDGFVDVVSANSGTATASVILGDGNGNLQLSQTYSTGASFPLAIDLGDIDGDGDLDMVVSNFGTTTPGSGKWRLWENDGNGHFIHPADYPAPIAASCAVLHDRDNDGDLDMTGIDEMDDKLILFATDLSAVNNEISPGLASFHLYPNYPNPFNPFTNIRFRVMKPGKLTVNIYNLSGELIRTLADRYYTQGEFTVQWDGSNSIGEKVASGIYFYQLSASQFSVTRKMVLLQ